MTLFVHMDVIFVHIFFHLQSFSSAERHFLVCMSRPQLLSSHFVFKYLLQVDFHCNAITFYGG